MKGSLLAAAACPVLAIASAGAAQTVSPNAASHADADADNSAVGSGQIDGAQDIVVTAQKKSESVQRVPAAVSVVGGNRLVQLGITSLTQISNVVPGISITPVRTQAFIFVRGVGQTLTSPNADPAVATNLNGVYLPSEIAGTAFFDVDRVEVLPGPQGTLYGRNSTGGVLNIVSRTPGSDPGVDGSVEFGNYARVQAVLGINVPLTDRLASRTSATIIRHDGYFNNGEDDQKTVAMRETLVWRPGDRTRITGVVTFTHNGGIGNVLQNIPFQECGARCANFDPKALGYHNHTNTLEGSLEVDQELTDDLHLTYIGGYSRLTLHIANSIFTGPPIAPLFLDEKIDGQSHELRLSGKFGGLETILGAYYFNQDSHYAQDATPAPPQHLINPFDGGSHGEAIFGQATYPVIEHVRLTGGLRYSRTIKSIDGFNSTYNAAGLQTLYRPYDGRSSLNRVDWKAGGEFDLTPRSLLYGNVSTGFTPGGFSTGPAVVGQPQAASIKPVYLRAYTAGIKNRLFGSLLTLNVEGFYYDYKNYQVSARDILTAQNLVFNAARATVYGVQVDTRLDLGRHDQLSAGTTYLHAKANRLATPTGNFDGFDLPYSPKWTANAFYQHSFDVAHGAQLRGSANFQYTSGRWAIYTHAPGFHIDANTHTDLNFGYFSSGERYSVQLFVRNLEDHLVKTQCGNVLVGQAGCLFEPPRTYGATLAFKY